MEPSKQFPESAVRYRHGVRSSKPEQLGHVETIGPSLDQSANDVRVQHDPISGTESSHRTGVYEPE